MAHEVFVFLDSIKRLFFAEVNPLVKLGRTRPLEESDFLELDVDLRPRQLPFDESKVKWERSQDILLGLFPLLKSRLRPAYSWYVVGLLSSLAAPILMNQFLTRVPSVVGSDDSLPLVLILGVGLGFCGLVTGFAYQQYFRNTLASYQIIVNLLNRKIFKHSLDLNLQAKQKIQIGDVVNHMSSDSESVADYPLIAADLVWAIVSILAGIAMMFFYLGHSAWVGLILLSAMIPLTRSLASNYFTLDEEMMAWKDKRVSLIGQALNAIRIVKYFVWEKSVKKEIEDLREHELKARTKLAKSEVLGTMSFMMTSSVVLFAVILTHHLRGQALTVPLVFTCLSVFALLEEPFGNLSGLISRMTAARVGAERIIQFLSLPTVNAEMKLDNVKVTHLGIQQSDEGGVSAALSVKHKTWGYSAALLKDINLEVKEGESVAVIGPVGSGKSTLLLGILGELNSFGGECYLNSAHAKIAYVPQEAYVLSGTLLENILFGVQTSNQQVRKALHVSCLDKDVRSFDAGLRTEIGEKGVNLSGGQKQRVALCRAVLQEAELVLLDDPLSAVDVATERTLCERLLFGEWKDKTRIVVTHRLESLSLFDRIVFMDQGKIVFNGKFSEFMSNPEFKEFVKDHATNSESKEDQQERQANQVKDQEASVIESQNHAAKLVVDEDREKGSVKGHLYWDYVKSLGGTGAFPYWIVLSLFLVAILGVLAPLGQKWWLGHFTSGNVQSISTLASVGIYGVLGILTLVIATYSHIIWLQRGLESGKWMHEKMLESVLSAPVSFFDSTPVGRILQRFSRDIETVDIHLQRSFESNVHCFIEVLVSLFLILTLMPIMLLVLMPIGLLYFRIQKDYRVSAREVKRLDSIARSPRYAHFKETLQGITVVRAFKKSEWYFDEFYKRLERSQKAFFNHYMLNRWFSARVPLVGGLVAMSSGFFVVLSVRNGSLSQATAGLVMTYAMTFWAFLNWGIRMFADVESRMTSIERLKFFMDLPSERSLDAKNEILSIPPATQAGKIEFQNVHLRYAPQLPLILKDLSFEVPAGARVGIIGRTGSGKSTLLQALYRFVNLESGRILIDDVDTSKMELAELRRYLAIIPQDPVLFIGTIRNNLDRYFEYTDQEVLTALELAGLGELIQSLPMGMNSPVVEGGANFSQGQRQLICMARALLIKSKVIIMDEATASVDVQNDEILQKVIRSSFKGITMLIVAHRLSTIEDADMIIELADGQLQSITKPV